MNNNQDGRLPVSLLMWTLKLGHLSPNFFLIYILATFIKLLIMSEYWLCGMNKDQDGGQNRYPIFTAGHYAGPFVGDGRF